MAGVGAFFSAASSIIFWMIAAMVVYRICRVSAGAGEVPDPKDIIKKWTDAIVSEDCGRYITTVKIVIFGVIIRAATLFFARIFLLADGQHPDIPAVFRSFVRWDAGHYINLARYGYQLTEDGRNLFVVFFPLYPWLTRFVNIFTGNYIAAAFVVSFGAFFAGLVFLYHLVRLDFSPAAAWRAVVLMSIFPTGLFYGAPHTESLFILTTAAGLYYIRLHKWHMAGIWGALATASRMVGVMLIAAAAAEFLMHYRIFEKIKNMKWALTFKLIFTKGVWVLLMFAGIVVYLTINWYISGDPLQFLYYQRINWHNGFRYFGTTMAVQFESVILFGNPHQYYRNYFVIPNILGFIIIMWMTAHGCMKRRNASYIVYSLGYTFVSFSMLWLLSGGRYAAGNVVLFVFLTDYIGENPKSMKFFVVFFLLCLAFLLRMYVLGGAVI